MDHELRCTDSRTERQLSEKINGFVFQRKEGVVVWRGRRWECMGGGVAADGSNMIYNLQICTNKVIILPFMNARLL